MGRNLGTQMCPLQMQSSAQCKWGEGSSLKKCSVLDINVPNSVLGINKVNKKLI